MIWKISDWTQKLGENFPRGFNMLTCYREVHSRESLKGVIETGSWVLGEHRVSGY